MDDQNKNLILAVALSMLVIIGWSIMFPPPEPPATDPATTTAASGDAPAAAPVSSAAGPAVDTPATGAAPVQSDVAVALTDAPRITIETPKLSGSISLLGGRLDTLSLKDYRETLKEGSDIVHLMNPVGQPEAYQALFGWAPGGALDFSDVPGPTTLWQIESGDTLAPGAPVTLTWNNGKGLTFRRTVEIDENYMFTVVQSVTNNGSDMARLAPEGRLERYGLPDDLKGFFILHEGAIRQKDESRDYVTYKKMRGFDGDSAWAGGGTVADDEKVSGNGWLGFTDHYWQAMLIPAADAPHASVLQYDSQRDIYRAIMRQDTLEVAPGETKLVTSHLFAGAKEWLTIRAYQNDPGFWAKLFGTKVDPDRPQIKNFIDSIDWGMFFFLTKPIFALLHWLHGIIGNMGWAIIGLTFVIKLVLFPLAYKSYASMAKMRELQPQMEKIKEQAGDDRQKLQQEMMALYKKEKVNPASGCLPILLQIPIFFSLYKVIFVTLELRHAPWIGWINDLSAPDPSSLYNLFGLLPWAAPETGTFMATVFLGLMPILLGVSMWLQQKLNPAPTDPIQQQIFAWMPWVFMFMLGRFASGLVLYWIANNSITFTQQYLIMRSHGYKPDVFGNIRKSFKRGRGSGA